jgi:chromate reductase
MMDDINFRILGLAGSLRRASFNRGLIRAAHELAPKGVMVEPYEGLEKIPFFNRDLEEEGDPAPVKELKEKIRDADAVLIATPEYDYAIPGVLSNALEWAMRSPSPLRHKPVGILGASPANAGTARGQMVLRQILLHAPAYTMPEPQMLIPNAHERFGENGDLVDEETRERMRRFLKALVEWTGRFERSEAVRERSFP